MQLGYFEKIEPTLWSDDVSDKVMAKIQSKGKASMGKELWDALIWMYYKHA